MQVVNGSTDISTYFVLRDSTNHVPKTDITVTDLDLFYVEDRAAISTKADASALGAADSAHTDNGAFHVGKGLYRIDWPDTCFDGGIGKKVQLIVECTGVDTTFLEVELVADLAAVKTKTDSLTFTVAGDVDANVQSWKGSAAPDVATEAQIAAAVLAKAPASESYATDGALPTLEQFMLMIWSMLAEKAISGTTITCKKLDGSTTSMTFTVNDASNPTSITRAT